MKKTSSWVCICLVAGCLGIFLELSATGQSFPSGRTWTYTLLDGSQLVDSCLICGRPDIIVPMRGTFQLRAIQETPFVSIYAVENISIVAGTPGGAYYEITGTGTYRWGGEVAVFQDLSLEVSITSGGTTKLCSFTNDSPQIDRLWPMLKASVTQTNGTFIQQFHLDVAAAPFREIWFSTTHAFHDGLWQAPTNLVNAGDLLASSGHIVRPRAALTQNLGIMPIAPDLGVKDIDILSGGEVAFSIDQDIFSETLGPLSSGDLLTDHGRVVASQTQLMARFLGAVPLTYVSLDAVQVLDSGEIYFSVQTNFFSTTLGYQVQAGDLLSSRGYIVRTNRDLIARFTPSNPKQDYGLRAVYVWPSGEIWFSTETGFASTNTAFLAGDLLSDQGYVVYRNLELLSPFAPVEDVVTFGLNGLFIVTDVTPPPPSPVCVSVGVTPGTSDLQLLFSSEGRVCQLERTSSLPASWSPLSPISLDVKFTDSGAVTNRPESFYRLRAW